MANRQIFKRRSFLKLAGSSLVAGAATRLLTGCTHRKFFNPDEDIILSGGSYTDTTTKQTALIAINLSMQEKRVINTPFLPHEILINPTNKYSIYCFEKNGKNACEVDLQSKSIRRQFQSSENKVFSGHASFSQDGKELYCIENAIDDAPDKRFGTVSIRDSKTLTIKQQLSSYGASAHDCQLLQDQTFVISNTSDTNKQASSLVYISLSDGKLIKRLSAKSHDINNNLNNGHFDVSPEMDVIIASAPMLPESLLPKSTLSEQNATDGAEHITKQSGGVSIKKHNGQLITMAKPDLIIKRMTGEALSIAINQTNRITAITHPEANLLTFWSIDKRQIVKAYDFENPRGICQTLDAKNYVVSYRNKPAMVKVSTTDLTPALDTIVQPTLATGEHIINWSSTLRQIMPKDVYS